MNYEFANLLGAPYRGGSLLFDGDTLICPSGNRVREVGLRDAATRALKVQARLLVASLADAFAVLFHCKCASVCSKYMRTTNFFLQTCH